MISYPIKHSLDDGSSDWATRNIKEMFPYFHDELVIKEDIVFSKKIDIFKDLNILIIGGGPTSKFLTINKLGQFDAIWSMNNFFLNPALMKVKIDLIVCGANTNLLHSKLEEYLYTYSPFMGFEPHPKYSSETTKGHKEFDNWKYIKKTINYYNFHQTYLKFAFQTKFWGFCGIGARLLLLAGHLGVKSCRFIGLDGYSSYKKGLHSFESEKGSEALPSSIKNMSENDAKQSFMNEYKILKKELNKFNTSYRNLAADHKLNDIGIILDQ